MRLYLPRIDAAPATVEQPIPEMLNGRGETILVVEHDPDVRLLAFALLRSLRYEVIDANGPQRALEAVRESSAIRLMLTDMVIQGR